MSQASLPLQLLHADICGPISHISNSHQRYLLTFIDDCSRKLWVFFLTENSASFKRFQLFKIKIEKEVGISIRALRTDRGGEFTSNEFFKFCTTNGIHRQLTTAFTPQQNGVAERKNRTIMNMVRSLLTSRQVPKTFWPEAVNWAVHVLNRSPTLEVRNKTPEEAWSGTKPSVAHFRVFGCVSYAHIPDNKQTKLDSKSLKCVLLGVSKESKAYRLYDPLSHKIIISRDVIFKEEDSWLWSEDHAAAIHASLEWGDINEDNNTDSGQNEAVNNNDIPAKNGHAKDNTSGFANIDYHVGSTSGSTNVDHHVGSPEGDLEQHQTINAHTTVEIDNVPSPAVRRSRQPPSWLQDYDSGEGFSDEDHQGDFALFVDADPLSYEDAARRNKWRCAMETEIAAIKKNNTWDHRSSSGCNNCWSEMDI